TNPQEDEPAVKEILVRLMGVQRRTLDDPDGPPPPKGPQPKGPQPKAPKADSPASKFYIAKDGFANYYFNKEATAALLKHVKARGDFSKYAGKWQLDGSVKFLKTNTGTAIRLEIVEEKSKEGSGTTPLVRMKLGNEVLSYDLIPNKSGQKPEYYKEP